MRPLFLCLVVGVLALGQNLEILLLSPPAKVRPGDFAVQVWQVTNHAPSSVVVRLAVDLPTGWEALGLPDSIPLGPGEEDYLFLTLYVPRTAKSGIHAVRIFFRWDEKETVGETTVEVEDLAAVGLSPPPAQAAQPGESLSFSLRVANRGNALDRIAVEVHTASGWKVRVNPAELPLAPGEVGEVQVTLEIPTDARVGREVVMATVRSGIAAEVESRTAWYVEVLPPGPERVPVQIFAELAMQGFGRFSHDFLAGPGTSFLGFSGQGTVLDGALTLSARWAGPWAPNPYQLLDFQATYVTDTFKMEAGRMGFSFDSLLSALGFWGLGLRLSLKEVELAFGSGWEGLAGRAGGLFLLRPFWGEVGGAYREERGVIHSQGGTVFVGLEVLKDLWFRTEAGAARVAGLTRFAGQTRLTWEIPELFFLEARGYAIDPGFPALVQDRAGILFSGRLGAEEAGFRFNCLWERDNLRGLSLLTRAWQGMEAGWDLFPANWPLRFGFGLSLRRTADLASPPALDERVFRAEGMASFSLHGFILGAQGAYIRFQDVVFDRFWVRQEFREWLSLRFSPRVSGFAEFRQVLFFASEMRVQGEARLSLSVEDGVRLSWEYGREGGTARVEFPFSPAPSLALKFGVEARWREEGVPVRFSATMDFSYKFSWAPPFLPVYGVLSGVAFADLNGNGIQDPGEPGVPGVILALEEQRVSTGKDGGFHFPGRPPGTYVVKVARLPPGYGAPVSQFSVSLELGKKTELLIPLVPLAEIRGVVFLDLDGDGVRAPEEPGFSRALIRLVSEAEEVREILSDPLGHFSFPELLPGKYWVELVSELLPPRHIPTTPAFVELVLAPGERREVAFGVWEQPRPVIVIQPPLAEFVWTPKIPRAGEPVLFDGTLSQAFNAVIVRYAWDFDDDGVIDAEGLRVSWTFPEPGFYLVTLVVTDSAGLTGQTQYLIQVRP
ncbi:PKD domain-containing protein [Candidatus Bipolaricaulota bacterium]|nr:PKD domain-containing protein [Candidatus Bipolaricaulota bacterium]